MHWGKSIRLERILNGKTKRMIVVPMDPGVTVPGNRDKTSLLFTLTDRLGALAGMLNRLAAGGELDLLLNRGCWWWNGNNDPGGDL